MDARARMLGAALRAAAEAVADDPDAALAALVALLGPPPAPVAQRDHKPEKPAAKPKKAPKKRKKKPPEDSRPGPAVVENHAEVCRLIDALVDRCGGSYSQVEQVTGLHRVQLSRWRRGASATTLGNLERLREALAQAEAAQEATTAEGDEPSAQAGAAA